MNPSVLNETDIKDITHFKRKSKQREALNEMGIDHRVRPDGTLLVLWSDVQHRRDSPARIAPVEPDMSAV